jgi:hypothetical protein
VSVAMATSGWATLTVIRVALPRECESNPVGAQVFLRYAADASDADHRMDNGLSVSTYTSIQIRSQQLCNWWSVELQLVNNLKGSPVGTASGCQRCIPEGLKRIS